LLHNTQIIFDFYVNKYQNNKYFLQLFDWWSLTPQFAALSHEAWQFLKTEISQGSVATQLRCGRMFNEDYCKFTNESAIERISKN